MSEEARDLLGFLRASPTPWHAVAESTRRLAAAGFCALDEAEPWALAPGERRFVVRGDGTLVAFVLGARPPHEAGFRIVGAHGDSPNLRLKPRPDAAEGPTTLRTLAVEPYGGVLLHTWLDRDLSLAGRVSVAQGGAPVPRTRLVDLRAPLLRIPSLAIHLQRELATEGLKLNAQQHLAPVLGLAGAPAIVELVAAALRETGDDVSARDVLAFDLCLYDVDPPSLAGHEGALISSARLDNLASCHAAVTALAGAAAEAHDATRVVVLYDHEEVGSRSAVGAAGNVLEETLVRLAGTAAGAADAWPRARARSRLLSTDMAHAAHPSFLDRHEPGHRPILGAGPVIKVNANQSYATDGVTAALVVQLVRELGMEPQHFVVRSDLPCGSTIGPISAARTGIATVDVGSPMLAMHSCRETAATADVAPMIALLRAFLSR